MGAIAGKYATKIFVTSDNPRSEDPMMIIQDIKAGMDNDARAKADFIPDRLEAIRSAVMTAKPNSLILIAGKGHEDYQIICGVKHHMDDRETVQIAFKERENLS
jgi:UDP-N-acetylmuramoyl-L-alanyl-D-glutamate--2,6-diaminopimelate ligase